MPARTIKIKALTICWRVVWLKLSISSFWVGSEILFAKKSHRQIVGQSKVRASSVIHFFFVWPYYWASKANKERYLGWCWRRTRKTEDIRTFVQLSIAINTCHKNIKPGKIWDHWKAGLAPGFNLLFAGMSLVWFWSEIPFAISLSNSSYFLANALQRMAFVKSMNNSFSEICTSPQYYDRILSKNEQFTVNSYCLQALKIGN